MSNEENEIVYDDPGSVTEIRKKFGIKTKSDFLAPKGVRSPKPLTYLYYTNQSEDQNNNSPEPSQVQQNNHAESFSQIINQGFVNSATNQKPKPLTQRPPIPQKPKIIPRKKKDISIFDRPQNSDILDRIASIQICNGTTPSFEEAVAEFYATVKLLDSTITAPPTVR